MTESTDMFPIPKFFLMYWSLQTCYSRNSEVVSEEFNRWNLRIR